MNISSLVVGQTYYRLAFADTDMTMPSVEPLVYLGLLESNGQLLATFQDTISYAWVGRYPGPYKQEQNIEVTLDPMKAHEAAEMLSLAELVEEINELVARAERLGFPTLRFPSIPPSGAA
jgi:hypothetical protein